MDAPETTTASPEGDRSTSRLRLLIDVLVFQFKLAADGLRDILLVPLSIISAIMGLVAGGDDPYRYFRDLLRLGRRTEIWINLFGFRKHGGTSDELIAPFKERVMTEAQTHPWISRAGGELNRRLDSMSERTQEKPGTVKRTRPGPPADEGP